MKKILFVCSGNICRSPMAEGIFNWEIKKLGLDKEFSAWSAGIYAIDSDKVTKHSVDALKDFEMDISNHTAQSINEELINSSYLVLTMTTTHKRELIRQYPEFSERIFTIYEFSEDDKIKNVEDPYGMPLETYKACANEIRNAIVTMLKQKPCFGGE